MKEGIRVKPCFLHTFARLGLVRQNRYSLYPIVLRKALRSSTSFSVSIAFG